MVITMVGFGPSVMPKKLFFRQGPNQVLSHSVLETTQLEQSLIHCECREHLLILGSTDAPRVHVRHGSSWSKRCDVAHPRAPGPPPEKMARVGLGGLTT